MRVPGGVIAADVTHEGDAGTVQATTRAEALVAVARVGSGVTPPPRLPATPATLMKFPPPARVRHVPLARPRAPSRRARRLGDSLWAMDAVRPDYRPRASQA